MTCCTTDDRINYLVLIYRILLLDLIHTNNLLVVNHKYRGKIMAGEISNVEGHFLWKKCTRVKGSHTIQSFDTSMTNKTWKI